MLLSFGGIIGNFSSDSEASVRDCYNTGEVSGTYGEAGGIIGRLYNSISTNKISSCYNVGNVSASHDAGSIIGKGNNANLNNCRWTATLQNAVGLEENPATMENNTGVITKEDLKVYADSLETLENIEGTENLELTDWWGNDELVEGSEAEYKYNNGYPVLNWQKVSY